MAEGSASTAGKVVANKGAVSPTGEAVAKGAVSTAGEVVAKSATSRGGHFKVGKRRLLDVALLYAPEKVLQRQGVVVGALLIKQHVAMYRWRSCY